MSWTRDADYEVRLDGRIVACFKPYKKIEGWDVCLPSELHRCEETAYRCAFDLSGLHVGSLLRLENPDRALYVRVTKVQHAMLRHGYGFAYEGCALSDEAWERGRTTHPGNPIVTGLIDVERI